MALNARVVGLVEPVWSEWLAWSVWSEWLVSEWLVADLVGVAGLVRGRSGLVGVSGLVAHSNTGKSMWTAIPNTSG